MKRSYRRHFAQLVIAVIGSCVVVAAFNTLVDPYSAYPSVALGVLGPGREVDGRRAKGSMLMRGTCEVLLLGSSRVESALDTGHPAFAGRRACNLGLNRHSVVEMEHILELTRRENDLSEVWLCLDFFAFNVLRGCGPDFDPTLYQPLRALRSRQTVSRAFGQSLFNPATRPWAYHVNNVLGRDATSESIKVLERAATGVENPYTPDGFRNPTSARGSARHRIGTSIRLYLDWTSLYGVYETGEQHWQALERMMAACDRDGITLHLIILPVHALHLEAVEHAGLWPALEAWKRRVVDVAHPAPVWDFQGYTQHTFEALPPEDAPDQLLQWFWESSHCRKPFGDLVISTVAADSEPATLGRRLTRPNVQTHLDHLRADRGRYRQEHPEQLEFFRSVVSPADETVKSSSPTR